MTADELREQLRALGKAARGAADAKRRDSAMRMVLAVRDWLSAQPDKEPADADAFRLLGELLLGLNDIDSGIEAPLLKRPKKLRGQPATTVRLVMEQLVVEAVEYLMRSEGGTLTEACAYLSKALQLAKSDRRIRAIYDNRTLRIAGAEVATTAKIETQDQLDAAVAAIRRYVVPPARRRRSGMQ